MSSDIEAWLAGLKVGDEVIVSTHYCYEIEISYEIEIISRARGTYVEIGNMTYNRNDGWSRGTNGPYRYRITAPTTEICEAIEATRLHAALKQRVEKNHLTLDQLRRILAITEEV